MVCNAFKIVYSPVEMLPAIPSGWMLLFHAERVMMYRTVANMIGVGVLRLATMAWTGKLNRARVVR
jgi:hypothetical protein